MSLLKEYFLQSLAKYPERDALEVGGKKCSYKNFHEVVSNTIDAIQKQGIQNKAVVVFNEHTLQSYASILAILFSGNAVLPIEVSWPKQRINNMLEAAKPAAILCDGKSKDV